MPCPENGRFRCSLWFEDAVLILLDIFCPKTLFRNTYGFCLDFNVFGTTKDSVSCGTFGSFVGRNPTWVNQSVDVLNGCGCFAGFGFVIGVFHASTSLVWHRITSRFLSVPVFWWGEACQ